MFFKTNFPELVFFCVFIRKLYSESCFTVNVYVINKYVKLDILAIEFKVTRFEYLQISLSIFFKSESNGADDSHESRWEALFVQINGNKSIIGREEDSSLPNGRPRPFQRGDSNETGSNGDI